VNHAPSVPFKIVVTKKPSPLEYVKTDAGYQIIVRARNQDDAEAFVKKNKFEIVSCTRVRTAAV
jgi:hypothetical protein